MSRSHGRSLYGTNGRRSLYKCFGIWFDSGEAERLKDKWMSEFLDSGDVEIGKANDEITDINCPICGRRWSM